MRNYSDYEGLSISGLDTTGDTYQLLAAMTFLHETTQKNALPFYYSAEPIPTTIKADGTPATIVDYSMEADGQKGLELIFPEAQFLGEEAVSALLSAPYGPNLIKNRTLKDKPRQTLTMDPIDSTTLLKARLPGWGPMISLLEDAEPVLGIILDAVADEFLVASKEINGTHRVNMAADGTFIAKKVTIPQVDVSDMKFFFRNRKDNNATGESFLGSASQAFGLGSEEIRCIAKPTRQILTEGTCGYAIINHDIATGIWDYAPAVYIIEKAGGYACRIDGTSPKLTNEMSSVVLAPRREVADLILRGHASLVA